MTPEKELNYCPVCRQMTNHGVGTNGGCLKCRMTPEKETPTRKGVDIAALAESLHSRISLCSSTPDTRNEIEKAFESLSETYEARLREVFVEILAGLEDYKVGKEMTRINATGSDYIYVYDLKKFVLETIAARHGITNLENKEKKVSKQDPLKSAAGYDGSKYGMKLDGTLYELPENHPNRIGGKGITNL